MPTFPSVFALCRRCFADELSGEAPSYTSKLILESVLWLKGEPPQAHRLAQDGEHALMTGCGHWYSTSSHALLPVHQEVPA